MYMLHEIYVYYGICLKYKYVGKYNGLDRFYFFKRLPFLLPFLPANPPCLPSYLSAWLPDLLPACLPASLPEYYRGGSAYAESSTEIGLKRNLEVIEP